MKYSVGLKNSVTTRLIKVVFGCYLIVTIVVTVVQMITEYNLTERSVTNEISRLETTFGPGIRSALWTFNTAALRSILVGINEIPVVVGVKITDGPNTYAVGTVELDEGAITNFSQDGTQTAHHTFSDSLHRLIARQFNVMQDSPTGKREFLGTVTIYSSSDVIFERVKHGFYLILVNAIIKTTALWLLFIYFARRIIGEPLLKLAEATESVNALNPLRSKISPLRPQSDELSVLEKTHNGLLDRLHAAHQSLREINENLECLVAERTADLKSENARRLAAQKEAETANEIKSMFIANVSHELRTPMTSIIGMTRLLEVSTVEPEKKAQLQLIVRNCNRLLTLVNDVLDVSKLEAGELTLELDRFPARQAINDIIITMQPVAEKAAVELSVDVAPNTPEIIKTDASRLIQILTNLLNNAIKFSKNGSVQLGVEPYEGNNRKLLFSVRDTGIGIAKAFHAQLFEPYTQQDSSTSRRFGGTGLGLSICKRLVELMGGEIWFESEEGKGTTFYFTIECKFDGSPAPLDSSATPSGVTP